LLSTSALHAPPSPPLPTLRRIFRLTGRRTPPHQRGSRLRDLRSCTLAPDTVLRRSLPMPAGRRLMVIRFLQGASFALVHPRVVRWIHSHTFGAPELHPDCAWRGRRVPTECAHRAAGGRRLFRRGTPQRLSTVSQIVRDCQPQTRRSDFLVVNCSYGLFTNCLVNSPYVNSCFSESVGETRDRV